MDRDKDTFNRSQDSKGKLRAHPRQYRPDVEAYRIASQGDLQQPTRASLQVPDVNFPFHQRDELRNSPFGWTRNTRTPSTDLRTISEHVSSMYPYQRSNWSPESVPRTLVTTLTPDSLRELQDQQATDQPDCLDGNTSYLLQGVGGRGIWFSLPSAG